MIMTDVLTKKQRSYCMSRIRGKNTQPESLLRQAISSAGIRGYRLHYKLLGKPDIVFPKRKISVFIDGCFWHKCPLCFKKPKSNKEYWLPKLERNRIRDKEIEIAYKTAGWNVVRIWEHDLS